MSYLPQNTIPRGQHHDSNGIPDYYEQDHSRQARHMPHPGAPPQGRNAPPHNQPRDPRMRPPHQQQYAATQPPQASHSNLYDGSEYGGSEVDQWPLAARDMPRQRGGAQQQAGPRRGPPPRPQRPEYANQQFDLPQPPRVASANRQYHQQPPPEFHHGTGEWTGDGYSIPGAPPPLPGPPLQGFPIAQQAVFHQQQRRPPLGPPPSARRGPPTYYSQVSSVHPIIEETDSTRSRGSNRGASQGSFASSNAIPIGIPDYYLRDRDSEVPSLPPTTPGSEYPPEDSPIEAVAPLRLTPRENKFPEDLHPPAMPPPPAREGSPVDGPTLVRQASIGKRSKPTLTTVKSGDGLRKKNATASTDSISGLPSQQKTKTPTKASADVPLRPRDLDTERARAATAAAAAGAEGVYEVTNESPTAPSRNPSTDKLAGFPDSSESSESERSIKQPVRKVNSKELLGASLPAPKQGRSRERSPLAPQDPYEREVRRKELIGSLEKGGAVPASPNSSLKVPTSGLSEARAGKPRPPRLNVDSVREAEIRGSLTSLPDLIKRATKLASYLDRGKTASRLGMTGWLDGNSSNPELNEKVRDYRKSGGSLSDILSYFPPPGLHTPPASRQELRQSRSVWSSHLRHSTLPSDSDVGAQAADDRTRRRRCCGLPLWLFLLLLLVLFLLVAAAVVVPVMLVWYPKHHAATSSAASCSTKLTCENGGQAVSTNGSCRCLCVNGYTGSTCSTQSDAGCTTISVGSMSDATVGDAVPRILNAAQSSYSIPLDSQALLGLFSSLDLSCSSQNALLILNGSPQKRSIPPTSVSSILRQRAPQATTDEPTTVTSNGIVFAVDPGTSAAPSASASALPPPPPPASGDGTTYTTTNATTLNFARTAILYILQSSSQLADATTAQQEFQSFFTSGTGSDGQSISAGNVTLGNGFSADCEGYRVVAANGTSVGG
nr:hypothetical protein B0A51_06566 [Rachicladosporium sp. CCFEE 5018]OQO26032.1 hypothetical protein B0A51_06717 [Rachicladosporium sp. CCFEE 5018]